jgi:chemotaxis protein MotB
MARKPAHEDHVNHEAWAIPYGDLVTLLLAFFVVMYAVSSLNEGKYRVLSDALSVALGGPPKSLQPIQIGDQTQKGHEAEKSPLASQVQGFEQPKARIATPVPARQRDGTRGTQTLEQARQEADFAAITDAIEQALKDLIEASVVTLRRSEQGLEIEINTDILFSSGVATVSASSQPVLQRLAEILAPFPQSLRIEGHTDDRPIATRVFPSNWELSAARAASVVHLFSGHGVDPLRMTVVGYGEHRSVADNLTPEGRNRNRRVVVVVMADPALALPIPFPPAAAAAAEPVDD